MLGIHINNSHETLIRAFIYMYLLIHFQNRSIVSYHKESCVVLLLETQREKFGLTANSLIAYDEIMFLVKMLIFVGNESDCKYVYGTSYDKIFSCNK